MGIKYTKLPDSLDVDKMIRERVVEIFGNCPYCGSERTTYDCWDGSGETLEYYDSMCKTLDGDEWEHRDADGFYYPKYNWVRMKFRCLKCGGKWESEYYPVGLTTSPSFIERFMSTNLTGENATLIVIKRDVERMISGRARIAEHE